MDEFYNKHYITVDGKNRILSGWSDGPHPDRDTAGAVLLTDKGGYQFRLRPDGEENPMLADMDGVPLYKLEDGYPVRRTGEEIEADRAAIQWKSEVEARVRLLKQKLSDTDYQAIKFSEGWFTEGEFAPMKAYRQSLRDKVNELENGGNPYTLSFGPGLTPTIVHSEEGVSE